MGAVFRWFFNVWVLLLWSLDLSNVRLCAGLLEVYEKDCPGTEADLMVPGGDASINRYEQYRTMYSGCTVVRGNLEIVSFELTDAQYDFDFLGTIREVNGYVLIVGNHVDRIRLNKLRVIRGMKMFTSTENGVQGNFSLYVAKNAKEGDDSVGLKELNLTSLVEITNGDILFKDNRQLCFGETTVNWNYILGDRKSRATVHLPPSEPGFEKRACWELCHESCSLEGDRYCWGRAADMCQAGRPSIPGAQRNTSCNVQCIGGCIGPGDDHCVACRHFIKKSKCVEECNKPIYNPLTAEWEKPPPTYIYGTQCVRECPGNMLRENGTCVAECCRGYMESEERNKKECVSCVGSCPTTCRGTDYWLHRKNIENFKHCTKVKGNLQIKNATLYGNAKLSVDDLKNLVDVEEITGNLEVDDASHPNLTSLSFLRNLRVIGGSGTGTSNGYSVYIRNTKLQSLNLNSLRQVQNGSIGIAGNPDLCYVYSINWTRLLTQKAQNISIMRNSISQFCEDMDRVCSGVCSGDGCWGPGDDSCLSCRNYSFERRCVSDCLSENGFYSVRREDGTFECRRCHEQCHMGCNGDGHDQCVACKNVQHNGTCVSECPSDYYSDLNGTCQRCHSACEGCYGEGTRLSENRARSDGCKNCRMRYLMVEDNHTMRCLTNLSECDKSFYVTQEGVTVEDEEYPVIMGTCRKCHPQCDGCKGKEATDCIECRNYKWMTLRKHDEMECISNCSYDDGYYDAGNSTCQPCDPECRECYGPSNYECTLCRNVRIYSDPNDGMAKEGVRNGTVHESYCADKCPFDQPNEHRNVNETERSCIKAMESTGVLQPKSAIPIFVFLFFIVVSVIVIGAVFWRKQKLRRLKESVLANDMIPMVRSGKTKSDMCLLRLIKESELRRGNKIGSGAFGTVYKGFWIPEKENIKIPVAIKVLQDTSHANQSVEFLDEARIMASVCNRSCVRILAVCMTTQMMLITQLMPLGCLLDYVRKEKSNIGSRALLLWSVQIAKGMKYLEEIGIVHRNLAARNVLVQNPNQVKIADFGLTKLLGYDEEEFHSEGGKMQIKWMALEYIRHRIYTHKSDVWSYGVTLWEIFTYGDKPYENLAPQQIPQALEKGERLPQPNICTIDVYMILIKCWMLDVDSRPTFSDLVKEFTRMAQDPGRFLVIAGDKLMRLPSTVPDAKDLVRLMSLPVDEPDLMVVSGDEYLRPMDLNSDGDSSFSPSVSSPVGQLFSIPEDASYVNTRPQENDELDQKPFSKNGKFDSQYSRQGSQRYIADPCRSEPGQSFDGLRKDNAAGQTIRLDKDGYLPPQSTVTAPSYLDVVYFSTDESVDTQDKQNLLDNKHQNLDMTNVGFSTDNPEYYEQGANYLIPRDCAGSSKQKTFGASENPNQSRSDYCNNA